MSFQLILNKFGVLKCYVWILFALTVSYSCSLLMPGSYPEAEYYEFDMSKEELISRVIDFKNNNQSYKLFKINKGDSIEYSDRYVENFFDFFLYFSDTHQSVLCVINTNATKPVRIGLTNVCNGPNFTKCKTINSEKISKKENNEIKEKFEKEILDKLGKWKRI